KAFAKGKNYKDAALLKELAALDKAEKAGPQAQLEALDDIEKQADALRKTAGKADKELNAYLDSLDTALAKERKAAQQRSEEEAQEEEEEATPALLTTRLVPLLRQVRKGGTMKAMIATTGKNSVVLLSRRPIAPARRKLLTEYLGSTGGVKF